MPGGERQTINFDLSDDEKMSASENQKREAEVRAEAQDAVEGARSEQNKKELSELRSLLNDLQGEQDVFQISKESERTNRLNEKDIEIVSDEEANLAEALNDLKKQIAKTPPPIPAGALSRSTPRTAEVRPVTSLEEARVTRNQKPAKKSIFSRVTNFLTRKKAA